MSNPNQEPLNGDETVNEMLKRWTKYGEEHLVGRKITAVRYITEAECNVLGWNAAAIVITLDDGTILFPSMDDEGNGAGALFGTKPGGAELTFPVIRNY